MLKQWVPRSVLGYFRSPDFRDTFHFLMQTSSIVKKPITNDVCENATTFSAHRLRTGSFRFCVCFLSNELFSRRLLAARRQLSFDIKCAVMGLRKIISSRATAYHGRTPGLRKLPLPATAIIVGVALANAVAWVAVGIVLVWELHTFIPNRQY